MASLNPEADMNQQTPAAVPFVVPCAERVSKLPTYVFATLFRMRDEALAAGREVFDLSVGNPDLRPAPAVVAAMTEALNDESWNCHRYGTFNGLPRYREAIANWYFERFGVKLDPQTQALPLIGSKEGLANLMRAYLNPGDGIIIPSPCYPAYFGAAHLCEADIWELKLREEDGYVPRLEDIPADVAARSRMLILNYPNNPTGGVVDLAFFTKAVEWCRRHQIMLVSDAAYTELGFDTDNQPPSVLQVPGAFDVAVEFQSLSKSHNLAGWRVGFVVGGSEPIANLGRLKSHVDFSLFGGIQMAAVAALRYGGQTVKENREMYLRRRNQMVAGLRKLGWQVPSPSATLYIWARIPKAWGDDDFRFVQDVFAKTGVLVSPGSGFGVHGRGYARLSLVAPTATITKILGLLEDAGFDWS
ncbi:MAG: aminotransferase class I/II-fold pyridoxal phosphate-dependent enzyme [bacterium]|nr:aminotransferase class I/II-fold pyridoxal phosphate-dependent enzyme [bacterium]